MHDLSAQIRNTVDTGLPIAPHTIGGRSSGKPMGKRQEIQRPLTRLLEY